MKSLIWQRDDVPGLEYFTLLTRFGHHHLNGTITLSLDDVPTLITYSITCELDWQTRAVSIRQERGSDIRHLSLDVHEDGRWRSDGEVVEIGDGIIDIDLEMSPCTNLLPIRRLNLNIGETQEFTALWVRFPDLRLERLPQRMTRLTESRYHVKWLSLGTENNIDVDADGLSTAYQEFWHRVAFAQEDDNGPIDSPR